MTISKNVALLMADLTGYTASTEVHGALSALKLIQTYMKIAGESLHGSSSILERVGDQIVIVSPIADDVAQTALSLVSKCYKEDNFLPVHVGLHYGQVVVNEGSLFGSAINLGARITSAAGGGEILCSEFFVESLIMKTDYSIGNFRDLKFKNILHPVRVAYLERPRYKNHRMIDPVCKMHIDQDAKFTCTFNGAVHCFCSDECRSLFEQNPLLFTDN